MIATDASVLIALFDPEDVHHQAAEELLTEHVEESWTLGPLTLAEVLVGAAAAGKENAMLVDLRALGIGTTPMPDDAGVRLARLRVQTGSKMPDCCVLLTAEQVGAKVATFDDRMARSARSLGMEVVGP